MTFRSLFCLFLVAVLHRFYCTHGVLIRLRTVLGISDIIVVDFVTIFCYIMQYKQYKKTKKNAHYVYFSFTN